MKLKTLFSAGTVLVCLQIAHAATPKLSGTYVINVSVFCQPIIDPYPSGKKVLNAGDYEVNTGTLTFDPAAGTADLESTKTGGPVLSLNSTGGQTSQEPYDKTGLSYSNTDTTLTLNGQTTQITYGTVKKGIALQFTFAGIHDDGTDETAPSCIQVGTATKP